MVVLKSDPSQVVGQWYTYTAAGRIAYAQGGLVNHYDNGGGVNGPGTGTSDSIPAYLSNGEYVVKASAVQQYGKDFFDGLNAQKFANGGTAKNIMNWVGNNLLGFDDLKKGMKSNSDLGAWWHGVKGGTELGSTLFGANDIRLLSKFGPVAIKKIAANIKEAKAFTHYAHDAIKSLQPSIGKVTPGMANYGPGTYGSTTSNFMGDTFGTVAHKLSLSPLAWLKTALGKGSITDDLLAKESLNFAKKTGKDAPQHLTDEFASFLSNKGYSGYKTGDVITNWKVGYPGFGLKNNLGKVPFGKIPSPVSYPELPELQGLVLAKGGYIPKFENGINSVPVDMLAQLHKNEAVIPANMNPFNPNANNATMSGAVYNVKNVTMNFAEAPVNGKALFAEFKDAIRIENSKIGGVKEFGSKVMS